MELALVGARIEQEKYRKNIKYKKIVEREERSKEMPAFSELFRYIYYRHHIK